MIELVEIPNEENIEISSENDSYEQVGQNLEKIDISKVLGDDFQSPKSRENVFVLEKPPEPITESDTRNEINEIEEIEIDDEKSYETQETDSSTPDPDGYKPSSLSIIAPLEQIPEKASYTEQLDNSPYTQSLLCSTNSSNSEYPWMEFQLPKPENADDSEYIDAIDHQFNVKDLVDRIRGKTKE